MTISGLIDSNAIKVGSFYLESDKFAFYLNLIFFLLMKPDHYAIKFLETLMGQFAL